MTFWYHCQVLWLLSLFFFLFHLLLPKAMKSFVLPKTLTRFCESCLKFSSKLCAAFIVFRQVLFPWRKVFFVFYSRRKYHCLSVPRKKLKLELLYLGANNIIFFICGFIYFAQFSFWNFKCSWLCINLTTRIHHNISCIAELLRVFVYSCSSTLFYFMETFGGILKCMKRNLTVSWQKIVFLISSNRLIVSNSCFIWNL